MIPGTGKETARLALAYLMARSPAGTPPPKGIYGALYMGHPIEEAARNLKLAERRELVAAGKLPGSSPYAHAVALAVDHVAINARMVCPAYQRDGRQTFYVEHGLAPKVAEIVEAVTEGEHDGPWFDAAGNAFLSFELEEDATLFRLALDA